MEDERDLKQAFLQEEILDKDYDPADFLSYLIELQGEEAADIDWWSLNDLKKVIMIG